MGNLSKFISQAQENIFALGSVAIASAQSFKSDAVPVKPVFTAAVAKVEPLKNPLPADISTTAADALAAPTATVALVALTAPSAPVALTAATAPVVFGEMKTNPKTLAEALTLISEIEVALASKNKELLDKTKALAEKSEEMAEKDTLIAQAAKSTGELVEKMSSVEKRNTVTSKAKPKVKAKPEKTEEYVALTVLDISDKFVVVASSSFPDVKATVTPGAKLPGGAIFIGFDKANRTMKTNQGDFQIP
jgi:hypothetical protein